METLKNFAKNLPAKPGCYIFIGEDENILYIGKSICLNKRVASYFAVQKDEKINRMIRHAKDIKYFITESDIEALLLEYKLIKIYRPPYNSKMKKDRGYWYINFNKISADIETKANKKHSFGPFRNEETARETFIIVSDYFKTATCQKTQKSCLRLHLKQCLAPCINPIKDYNLKKVINFLSGDSDNILDCIKNDIITAADKLEFEQAARLRDIYNRLKWVHDCMLKMIPPLENREYMVLLKSRHDNKSLLIHLKNKLAINYQRINESPKPFLQDEMKIMGKAAVEIECEREFTLI